MCFRRVQYTVRIEVAKLYAYVGHLLRCIKCNEYYLHCDNRLKIIESSVGELTVLEQ